MLFNKLFRLAYPIISISPLFLLFYTLFYDQLYLPLIYFTLQIPLILSAGIVSNNYIKNNLHNFEVSEKVLSGIFIIGYIIFNLVIFAAILKLKLLMLIIPIPTVLGGILVYVLVGVGVINKGMYKGLNELYEHHLKETVFIVSLFSSIKTLIVLVSLICKLYSNNLITYLFILTFILDIAVVYLLREESYKFIKKNFSLKKSRKSISIILIISLFSFIVSNSGSIFPYTKIIDFKINKNYEINNDLYDNELEEPVSDSQIVQSLDREFNVSPILITFWKFIEKLIYITGFSLILYFVILPLIIPIIKSIKEYKKFSLKVYLKNVIEAFRLLFIFSKDTMKNRSVKNRKNNKAKKSNTNDNTRIRLYKGIEKYFIKSVKWVESKEKKDYRKGLTVSMLLKKINNIKKEDNLHNDRLKQLYYQEFYSDRKLSLSEIKEVKELTKTLLKGK